MLPARRKASSWWRLDERSARRSGRPKRLPLLLADYQRRRVEGSVVTVWRYLCDASDVKTLWSKARRVIESPATVPDGFSVSAIVVIILWAAEEQGLSFLSKKIKGCNLHCSKS